MANPVKPAIIFRVDATPLVALGHLKRCLALAERLKESGSLVFFLTSNDTYAVQLIHTAGFPYRTIDAPPNTPTDSASLIEMAGQSGVRMVVIDSYEIDNQYRQKLMKEGLFVISITDSPYTNIISHVIINGNLHAEALTYTVPDGTKLLTGIQYLILGREFWHGGSAVPMVDHVHNVLITMGGIDHYDLTATILRLLEASKKRFTITVIIGPYYTNRAAIENQVKRMRKRVEVVETPPTLYTWMSQCSLAFSAGGQTLYELAVLGRPTVGISLWENQEGNVSALAALGALRALTYRDERGFVEELEATIVQLLEDSDELRRLSKVASSIVDGKGAERVARAIIESYKL